MSAALQLVVLPDRYAETRTVTDRLELLQTLIAAPSFDPLFRSDVLRIPGDHPFYGWLCKVEGCERSHEASWELCHRHRVEWSEGRAGGGTFAAFLAGATPFRARSWSDARACLICPELPAVGQWGVCTVHGKRWISYERWMRAQERTADFDEWLCRQSPLPGLGTCRVLACPELADLHPLRMCSRHRTLYDRQGRPGDARVPDLRSYVSKGAGAEEVPVAYGDEAAFRRWCAAAPAIFRMNGVVSLLGLRPLVRAEIQWTLFRHAQGPVEGAHWQLSFVQHLVQHCRDQDAGSLADLEMGKVPVNSRKIATAMLRELRQVYFTRQDAKQAGFIEFDHFGVVFPNCNSHFDLSSVSQRWLRDLLWDYYEGRLRNNPPRSQGPFKATRRGCVELSAYLEAEAPGGGHDPVLLSEEHMVAFIADQRHRAEHGLAPLGRHADPGGRGPQASRAGKTSVARIFDAVRRILRFGMDEGIAADIGLDRRFITAAPTGGGAGKGGRRRPFSDEVARALASEGNLALLDQADVEDRGLQDIWEALVVTGRRCNEIIRLRFECLGRINGLPLLWHDQTKIGNLEEGIRIPERLFRRIEARQAKTVDRFVQRHGRPPNAGERVEIALFPRRSRNRAGRQSMSYGWFQTRFSTWVGELDISCVAHQARHTLATNLLISGANLSHVKRYLGHVSDAMAEHYVHLANTDPRLEDALNTVWVSGPGAAQPGLLLSSGEPMTRRQAEALAIDLTRVSTPAEGGFCTFQPVVDGNACPWNMDCHNCEKFVMSGADLVYWHRKREQWRMLAERASDPATADFLHEVFDPTARAIEGLEKALAAVGLLDEALTLDLRRPQDYFGRVWATAFRARGLARHLDDEAVDDEYDAVSIEDSASGLASQEGE